MADEFHRLVLGSLAAWRLTHLFNAEDGPWDLLVKLRRLAGSGFWGGLLDCFYCLSLWLSAPIAFSMADTWPDRLILWLAISAGACILERATARHEPTNVLYTEDPEK